MEIETVAAGSGITGAIIAALLLVYRIFFSKKSRCHGEFNGVVVDIRRDPPPHATTSPLVLPTRNTDGTKIPPATLAKTNTQP